MTRIVKSDADLQRDVMGELAWDTRIDETAIGVSVHHGVVTLNGVVAGWAAKHAVEEATQRVAGVLDIANDIEIKPSWTTKRSDAEIAEAVRSALEWDAFVPHDDIRSTVTDDGHVTLTGEAGTLRVRDDIERLVRNLAGVRSVSNEVTVEAPDVAALDLRSSIKDALERHVSREAEHITVDVRGHTVALTGTVGSWTEHQAVIGAAKGTRGVKRIDDYLRIVP